MSGVAVRKLKLIAFALTGSTAALAGIMYASRVASANPTRGSSLMLNAIAGVFLGSTLSEHGEPRILYTIVGVLIPGVLDNGLTQMSVDSYIRQIWSAASSSSPSPPAPSPSACAHDEPFPKRSGPPPARNPPLGAHQPIDRTRSERGGTGPHPHHRHPGA
ncbi:hypothetical protein N8D56_00380 [Devosia sp. A8/3-2]|nr:hypothetical protein N8D56_00380 [Devosia sp. A8/3-2]